MKTSFIIPFALLFASCGSYNYFYSTNKDRGIPEYKIGSIKTELECSVVGENIVTVRREAFDTANYKHIVYTSYVDSLMYIKNITYSFIIPDTKGALVPDTVKNSLSFGERPENAFFIKLPLSKEIELHIRYQIDSNRTIKTREKMFLLYLHRTYSAGKGLSGC